MDFYFNAEYLLLPAQINFLFQKIFDYDTSNLLKFIQTPNPTPTILNIPPSADPSWVQLMIIVVLITVIIVIIGVWINRKYSVE